MSDMVIKLLDDMDKALDAECYFAALAIALMFPDICGKAEYGEKVSNKTRYIRWFDNWVSSEPWTGIDGKQKPQINGEVAYQLRNSFLHQGTADISCLEYKSVLPQSPPAIANSANGVKEIVTSVENLRVGRMYFDCRYDRGL